MIERLQKFLSRAGVASRRHAEALIAQGRVRVNNVSVTELGVKVDGERDLVAVDGKLVTAPEQSGYFLLYKPAGVVTTLSDPQGRPTLQTYLAPLRRRLYPVGRLDYDAEGALLLTDDGQLANRLMHPRYQVPRVYLAKVRGDPDDATLDKLRGGVRLEDGLAKPTSIERFEKAEKNTWLQLVVTEGRPHLIKRLCAAVGHPVVRLYRPSTAGISLNGLRPGELRPLTAEEVKRVRAVAEGEAVSPPAPISLPPRRHGRAERGSDDSEQERPARELVQRRAERRTEWQEKGGPRQNRAPRGGRDGRRAESQSTRRGSSRAGSRGNRPGNARGTGRRRR